jgi:hypothetical protein
MSTPEETRQPPSAPPAGRVRLTVRGCVVLMLLVFLVSDLIGSSLGWGWLDGVGYGAGCLLAVAYARREALLLVATAPPALFLIALVTAELVTATGSTLLATAEGTLLALATCAPWLFVVTVAGLALAMKRGLLQCIRDLKGELGGQGMGGQAGFVPPTAPAQRVRDDAGRSAG